MGFAQRARNRFLSWLASSARGRRRLERWIVEAQFHLGIGAGSHVESSGERVVLEVLRARTAPGEELCIFDVGANQGQYLRLLLAGLGERSCRIHCFEPSAAAFARLQKNAGSAQNVVLNPFGLGKLAGEHDLYSDAEGSGLASLSKRRLDHYGIRFDRSERVRLETLDAYCERNGVGQLGLLKIDVEGHELEVLAGGARMFAERRVRMVSFEFGGTNIDSRTFFQDFFYFFADCGMQAMFRILPSGGLARIDGYAETLEQFRPTNFLVLRDA